MVQTNEERRTELIEMIDKAYQNFKTSEIIGPDGGIIERYSMRRRLPIPPRQQIEEDPFEEGENADWESDDGENEENLEDEQPITGPELLGTRSKDLVAYRMRALAQVRELLATNRHATKRDLFYESKALYKNQRNFDRALAAVCKFLNASRTELHVVSCSKGFAIGDLRLYNAMDESEVDFHHSTIALNEALTKFDFVHSEATFLLVVEKDSVFQRLLDEGWTKKFPKSILLTGRGYPDICTRFFLAWLAFKLPKLHLLTLVDADPYGIEIFLTYKFGSERSRVESGGIQLPRLKWIGFLPSEAELLSIPQNQFLPLLASDKQRIGKLADRVIAHGEESAFDELMVLMRNEWKLEIEALCSIGPQFLTSYLKYKLQPYQ